MLRFALLFLALQEASALNKPRASSKFQSRLAAQAGRAAASLSRVDKANLATNAAAGTLAVFELKETFYSLSRHHGLALIALSRGAKAISRIEKLVGLATLRALSAFALVAAAVEVVADLKPGGHHGLLLLAIFELFETSEGALSDSKSWLKGVVYSHGTKLVLAAGALACAAVEL
eukprot:CAMPEP_0119294388 /NCGR_PEP_ID=MMETSP1329-20130426/47890_1 /TAXON_ID=114041 /ORGANISM="Genus nov. species nov., Strain RCC1024" /LENGTH=175 /DNA_ID=CAMNT_0007295277 /DNA_START=134 /DNA_END=658 /DNA_ORIENTATION=-